MEDVLPKILGGIDRFSLRDLLKLTKKQNQNTLPAQLIYPGRVIGVQGKLRVVTSDGEIYVELRDTPRARLNLTLDKPAEILKSVAIIVDKRSLMVFGIVDNIRPLALKAAIIAVESPEPVGSPRQLSAEDATKINEGHVVETQVH
jgi:hypothetical protein